VKRTKVGADDLGTTKDAIEILADDTLSITPFAEPTIAPDDDVVRIQQHDAVGHAFENAITFEQTLDLQRRVKMPRVDIDTRQWSAGHLRESRQRRLDANHLVLIVELRGDGAVAPVRLGNYQKYRFIGQSPDPW